MVQETFRLSQKELQRVAVISLYVQAATGRQRRLRSACDHAMRLPTLPDSAATPALHFASAKGQIHQTLDGHASLFYGDIHLEHTNPNG